LLKTVKLFNIIFLSCFTDFSSAFQVACINNYLKRLVRKKLAKAEGLSV